MLILLVGAAFAGPIFTTVGAETSLGEDGNWPRLFPAAGGFWHFLHATEGDYQYVELDPSFVRVEGSARALTGSTILRDHGVSRCPDGSYIDAATADLDRPADSLYIYHFDPNFRLLESGALIERAASSIMLADVPSICGELFRGVAWLMPYDSISSRYSEILDDWTLGEAYPLVGAPQAMGSSLLEDEGQLRVIGFPTLGDDHALIIASYDETLTEQSHWEADIVPAGWTPYWAQASMRVGDVYIVAHMAQNDAYSWATQGGDLWLEAFDLDWVLIDQVRVTENTPPVGGMQPGMARVDDRLVLTYTKDLHNYIFAVSLDLVACGAEPDMGGEDSGGDSGGDTAVDSGRDSGGDSAVDSGGDSGGGGTTDSDSGGAADADDTASDPPKGTCGCAQGASGEGGWLALAAAMLALCRLPGLNRARPRV